MKCAYEAANGVEAHMVANMLEQHAIDTRIDGEHLASGVGELPAAGLVRVMVDEHRYDRAREIIREWEAKSPPTSDVLPHRRSYGPAWFALGLAVGIATMSWLHRPQSSNDGIDFDGDGRLDERYSYSGQYVSKVESDRDLDGKVDAMFRYDSRGVTVSGELDADFDGRFESQLSFQRGLVNKIDIDLDWDGKIDTRENYTSGVLREITLYATDGITVIKREHYRHGIRASAEYDSDGDGILETQRRFDRYGEIVDTAH